MKGREGSEEVMKWNKKSKKQGKDGMEEGWKERKGKELSEGVMKWNKALKEWGREIE